MLRAWLDVFNRQSQVFSEAALCIRYNYSHWQVREMMLRMCFIDVLIVTQLILDGSRIPNQVYTTSNPISKSARSQVAKDIS